MFFLIGPRNQPIECGIMWCSTWIGSSFTSKYLTVLKGLFKDKQSSLFGISVGNQERRFHKIDARGFYYKV
jgi:hypothetical protein